MASKLIVTRQQLTSSLHAALQAFAGATSPALGERLAPFVGDDDPGFDFEALHEALAAMIEVSLDRLVAADEAHIDELTFAAAPRDERDRRVKAVRAKLIDVRRIVGGLFGVTRAREIVAVDGATAEQPELLWRQAEHTLSRLRDPELSLPPASTGAVFFDAEALADELEPLVAALREAIDGCETGASRAAVTLQVKKEAMTEHDRLMSACGKILSGLCLLVDRPDLARRVRVTPRRRRGSSKATESVTDIDATAPQNSSKPVTNQAPVAAADFPMAVSGFLVSSPESRDAEQFLGAPDRSFVADQILDAKKRTRDSSIAGLKALPTCPVESETAGARQEIDPAGRKPDSRPDNSDNRSLKSRLMPIFSSNR